MNTLRLAATLALLTSQAATQVVLETNGDPVNDTIAGAELAVIGSQHYGAIAVAFDEFDYWQVQIPASGGRLTVWPSGRGSSRATDVILRIRDANDSGVRASHDDRATMNGLSAWVEGGTHYVLVRRSSFYTGDYAFDLWFEPGGLVNAPEIEPNDMCAQATPVPVNSTRQGLISSSSDVDFYQFVLTQPEHIRMETVVDSSMVAALTDAKMWVYDGTCSQIASGIGRLDLPLGAGTYFVELANWNRALSGYYRFELSRTTSTSVRPTSSERIVGTPLCAGATAMGDISVASRPGERAHVGTRWSMDLFGVRPVSALLVGSAAALPLDLTPIGAPGCRLGIQTLFASVPIVPTAGSDAEFGIDLGGMVWLGASFQAVAIDPGANALGVIASVAVVDITTGDYVF